MTTNKKVFRSRIALDIPRDKPLIFWDTCGLLKILHIPDFDEKNAQNLLNHFCWISDEIEANRITSVTSELVISELSEHLDKVTRGLKKNQEGAKKDILKYCSIEKIPDLRRKIENQLVKIKVEKRLLKLLNKIVRLTYIIKEHSQFGGLAHYRVLHKLAPAAVKGEYKDCYIWVTYLTLINEVVLPKSVFYTDNKEDFFQKDTPQTQISNDLIGKSAFIAKQIWDCRILTH